MTETISVWMPITYASLLIFALFVFSSVYRARKQQQLAHTSQFYQNNFNRDIYFNLKNSTQTIPQKLLSAALLAWSSQDFARVMRLKDTEPSLNQLHQSGLVGDMLHEQVTGTQTLLTKEIGDIMAECVKEHKTWQHFPKSSTEVAQQCALRKRMSQLDVFKQEFYELTGCKPGKEKRGGKAHGSNTIKTATMKMKIKGK